MPVWQRYHEEHRGQGLEILSVAVDAQGAGKARPFVETAQAEFTTLIDDANLLGQLYGFKAIPNGYLIDDQGVVRYKKVGGFDIRSADTASVMRRWIEGVSLERFAEAPEGPLASEHSQASACFRSGLDLYQAGNSEMALSEWRKGVALDPDNYIIRKQIWAVESPEKFYSGCVDFDWQKEQFALGL